MTYRAIFRQHWMDAFRDAAFTARLHDGTMAERWARERFAEGFLPRSQRLDCRSDLGKKPDHSVWTAAA